MDGAKGDIEKLDPLVAEASEALVSRHRWMRWPLRSHPRNNGSTPTRPSATVRQGCSPNEYKLRDSAWSCGDDRTTLGCSNVQRGMELTPMKRTPSQGQPLSWPPSLGARGLCGRADLRQHRNDRSRRRGLHRLPAPSGTCDQGECGSTG
jgi:hypothetical protein